MSKPRLLWVGDAGCSTGFARVTHAILDRLTDKYDISVLAINYNGFPHKKSYRMYPALQDGDYMGVKRLNAISKQVDPDATVLFQDFWNIAGYIQELETHKGLVAYYPVDSENVKPGWLTYMGICPSVATYTKFAADQSAKAVNQALDGLKKAAEREGRGSLKLLRAPAAKGNLEIPYYRLKELSRPEGYKVIPHGIDTEAFHPVDKAMSRAVLGLPNGFIVLNVNRNQPRKRLDLTIRGFAEFAKDKPDAKLVLHCWGVSPNEWDLDQLAQFYGVADKVLLFHRYRPDLDDNELNMLYNAADVVINTSGGEGWGLCVGADTMIHTAVGPKRISEVVVGDQVLTDQGTFSPVEGTTQRVVSDWYDVSVVGCPLLQVTPEHPFLAVSGANLFDHPEQADSAQWKAITQLRKGDFVALGSYRNVDTSSPQSIDLAALLPEGWLWDDDYVWHPMGFSGTRNASITRICHALGETKKVVEKAWQYLRGFRSVASPRVIAAAEWIASQNYPPAEPVHYRRHIPLSADILDAIGWYLAEGSADAASLEFSMHRDERAVAERLQRTITTAIGGCGAILIRGNQLRLSVSGAPVAAFFRALCGEGAAHKQLSYVSLNTPAVLAVWRAWLLGDGHIATGGIASVTTVSESLAFQAMVSLRSLGISCSLHKEPPGKLGNYHRWVLGLGNEAKTLLFGGCLPEGYRSQSHTVRAANRLWARIDSITPKAGTLTVHDLCVPDTHSFVGHGIVLHNTSFEAASVGKPVIVPDYSATAEIWKDAALLTPIISIYHELQGLNTAQCVIDTHALAQQLTELYEDRDLCEKVGARCKAVTERPEYNWDNIAQTFDRLIQFAAEKGTLVPRAEPL